MRLLIEIQKLFEDKTIEVISVIVTALFIAINRFFKKLPGAILHRIRRGKQLDGLQKGSAINNIIRKLALDSGAIYVHLIRYHNGGPYKMTVEWESIGRICHNCVKQCGNFKSIKPLQSDWSGQPVSNIWSLVIQNTIKLDGLINEVDGCNFDKLHKDIWIDAKIHSYKEIVLKHKANKDTWCLGLSFCERFNNHNEADIMMEMASRKLKKLL